MNTILFITLWIATSILTYGLEFAFFQRRFSLLAKEDYGEDVAHCLLMSLLPFVGLIVVILFGRYRYGLKFY